MKRMIAIFILPVTLAIYILSLALTGCGEVSPVEKAEESVEISRFIEIERAVGWKIVADKETGVMYAVSNGGYNNGNFTLLVDENGKPLIWDGENDE